MTATPFTSSFVDHALEVLKSQGLRITRQRRLVLAVLDTTDEALSAYEMKDRLTAQGEAIDTVSIYRIFDCLETHQLVHRVLSSGKVRRCALGDETACDKHQHHHCHHFLICQGCGRTDELHCPEILDQLEARLEALAVSPSGFRITGHHLELMGLCPACQ